MHAFLVAFTHVVAGSLKSVRLDHPAYSLLGELLYLAMLAGFFYASLKFMAFVDRLLLKYKYR